MYRDASAHPHPKVQIERNAKPHLAVFAAKLEGWGCLQRVAQLEGRKGHGGMKGFDSRLSPVVIPQRGKGDI